MYTTKFNGIQWHLVAIFGTTPKQNLIGTSIFVNFLCFSTANTECYKGLFDCGASYVIPPVVNGNSSLPQVHSSSNIKSLLVLCQ